MSPCTNCGILRTNYPVTGGSVELNLANYDSHSSIPTRTIGDPSTETDYPSPDPPDPFSSPKSSYLDESYFVAEQDGSSAANSVSLTERPRHITLPSPKTFTTPLPTPGSNSTKSTHTPSPLSNQGFQPASISPQEAPCPEDQIHVLVVDDDKLTRTLMQRLMERLGCAVTTAENGEIALKILLEDWDDSESISEVQNQQSRFSIVFLDNQMPVLSGLKVVKKLREIGRHDFVVGVTGEWFDFVCISKVHMVSP